MTFTNTNRQYLVCWSTDVSLIGASTGLSLSGRRLSTEDETVNWLVCLLIVSNFFVLDSALYSLNGPLQTSRIDQIGNT